ncbi:C-type lectin domain family 4 member G [Alligator sinensis]|uniref:C-type lectin domain family 4 member G n=1 Tax=Alligator sinensis TaxID=38654 RepID=A0A1U8DVB1_ALLSI|nr:C-type lectin domain family 4 member G [Alligator sinensis]
MAPVGIYRRCQEPQNMAGGMGAGTAGYGALLGGGGRPVLALYAVHAVSFLLWAVLLATVIGKYAEMSRELEKLRTDQALLRANGSDMTKQLQILRSNQSGLQGTGGALTQKLENLEADLKTTRQEVATEKAQMENSQTMLRKETYRILAGLRNINASACAVCPPNWLLYAGACYFFATTPQHWSFGRSKCQAQGAHLVIINDSDEQSFLAQKIKGKEYWIGLHDTGEEGKFTWVDDSSATYTNWDFGEPNNQGLGEDCVMMLSHGRWNDAACAGKVEGWICEKEWSC